MVFSSRVLLLVCFSVSLCLKSASSQDFRIWGATGGGGPANMGTIYSIRPDDSHTLTPKSITGNADGINPGCVIEGPDGRLYGVNNLGGDTNKGTIFGMNTDGTQYLVMHSFSGLDGVNPLPIIRGTDNVIYGMTMQGGQFNYGVIFKINPDGTGFQKLYDFDGTTGHHPKGTLLHASDGFLYGHVSQEPDGGFLFKIQTNGSGYAIVKNFSGIGRISRGTPVEGPDGKIYATVFTTAASNQIGYLYSIRKDGTEYAKLFEFNGGTNGMYPTGYLTFGPDGHIYGSTNVGGVLDAGMVYRIRNFATGSPVIEKILDRPSTSRIIFISGGIIMGVTSGGGLNSKGTVFSMKPDGSQFTIKFNFGTDSGILPNGLMLHSDGNFYGTTLNGAASNSGTIFKLSTSGVFTRLKQFPIGPAGSHAGLIKHSNGKLYGITVSGGAYGFGAIYCINTNGVFQNLFSFNETVSGREPKGSLLEGQDGTLFGMTRFGGSFNQGVVFRINPDGTNFIKMRDMSPAQGSNPEGSMIQISETQLMAAAIGGTGGGVIFKINTDGSNYANVFEFPETSMGLFPSDLIIGADGFLYGGCGAGGLYGKGTLYKIKPDGTMFTKLFDFDGANGEKPGKLFQATNGYLFGVTSYGGAKDAGVLFRIQPDGSDFSIITNFSEQDGRYPGGGSLSLAPDGKIYGVTSFGGSNGVGTMFRVNIDGLGFGKIYDFNNESGFSPGSVQIVIIPTEPQSITFSEIFDTNIVNHAFPLSAFSTSGLPVAFESSDITRATIGSTQANMLSPGRITIKATQEGDLIYSKAIPVSQTVCIMPDKPLIQDDGQGKLVSSSDIGNQWYFNGEIITGANGQKYQPEDVGFYSVQVKVDDCAGMMSDVFEVTVITDIEHDSKKRVDVYPNPVHNNTTIKLASIVSEIKVALYDVIGSLVSSNVHRQTDTIVVDMESFRPGTYFLKLDCGDGFTYTKIIKH